MGACFFFSIGTQFVCACVYCMCGRGCMGAEGGAWGFVPFLGAGV